MQACAWRARGHTSLQGKACKPVSGERGDAPACREKGASQCADAPACSQNPASQCVARTGTHQLAAKTLQASAPTHQPATKTLQASAWRGRGRTSLQPKPCKPVHEESEAAPACREKRASQCANAPACNQNPASHREKGASQCADAPACNQNPASQCVNEILLLAKLQKHACVIAARHSVRDSPRWPDGQRSTAPRACARYARECPP